MHYVFNSQPLTKVDFMQNIALEGEKFAELN